MDDNGQRSLQKEQWLPVFDKGEKRASSLGSGAFRFIRTRSSIRRELKRQCNRSKNESSMSPEVPASSGGGGLGKWLRDHLGGGSKSHQDSSPTLKSHGTLVEGPINEKPFGRAIYASQNLYCSLPREHNRHGYNVSRKTSHGNSAKSQGHDRQRSNSVNNHNHHHHYHHHEKANLAELGSLTRGGPIYGSEGKSLKKRNRDRRRHSLNESHDLAGRQRRRRIDEEMYNIAEEEEFEDEDESEEEVPEEPKERQDSIDDLDDWYVPSYHSLEGEKYKQSFEEGEEEAAEEEIPLSPAYSEEKFLAEERQVEYDHVFDQLHPEADGDREVVIDKLKELHSELTELKRRNKLMEVWVLRCLKKNQQQITRTDPTKSYEDLEAMYKEELRVYKMQVDDIQSQQNELMFELQNYIDKVQSIGADTDTAFRELLDREKDVAVDLVFEKTGKKVTEKMMNALTRRQIARSKVLAQGRQKFIYLKHRLEELQARLKSVETLGEGMTTMDYEALHVANIGYKDKLDEREQELESLRIKIAKTVNGVAQYKEKEICLAEDIVFEEERLKARRSRTTKFRGRVNNARVKLKQLRDEFNEKKNDAGLLVALCIPDGGDVGYTMTELQPSPPGYRVQDEAPGPPSCPPGQYKYASHGHGAEPTNFKSATSYPPEGYALKQSPSRSALPNDYYTGRRRNDGRRTAEEHESGNQAKKPTAPGYNESHKKNTAGYKNDSGYSESVGFDSFTLPLNERDEASPPPTPPVRDASSLKGVCYGPGHEKYPSWPSAPERHPDEDVHGAGHNSGSHRSKSWTDHTNYPKEKPAQYTRPHTKRPNPAFTQQLKTVMERCEKIPAETFESRNRANVEEEPRLWPRVDREGKALGDEEYVVPSPPEREQQTAQTLSHADLEAYVRSYQDPQVSQVDIYREATLTQAGLEEYTRVQHSQQASYAQSEGYHSYVSSVDSTTNTPFLDRLRRDSEAVAQRPTSTWEDTSREGRDSVVTTSSGSASSSETLKWHGSMSDVSVSSGLPARQSTSDRWHHGSMSDVSSVNGGILPRKSSNGCHDKWQGSMSDVSSTGLSPTSKGRHSEKWPDKWQVSMNDRNKQNQGRSSLPAVISHCSSSTNVADGSTVRESKWQESNIDEESLEKSQSNSEWDGSMRIENDKYGSLTQPMPQSPVRQPTSPQSPETWNPIHGSMSDVSQANGLSCSKQLIAHSARVQTPQRHHSESVLYLDRERNQRKLYPVSTTQPQESSPPSRMPSSQQPQMTVAERINELEKQQQQQMRYTYLDPEKRHRVSDPTLKAIQKKALLSFYERHHQASWRSEPQLAQGTAPAPQSPPPQPPPRPRPSSSRRASSASDYASGAWRENANRSQNQGNGDLPSPKHQHSNSCGSLSTDLLGPVIVGPAISIDDWVPERPPKKPHLRNVFNDRVPSPDLPPPSPPTVTENEVHDCDDPLPPPPPELSEDCFTDPQRKPNHHPEEPKARDRSSDRHKLERHSMRRSKHGSKRELEKSTASGTSTPNSPTKTPQEQDHPFVRATIALKHAESELVLENGVSAGFATHRMVATGRSSLRYPSTQKLMVNGRVTPARRISDDRSFANRPPAQLPDLISQRYSDSGNQRPAPQVPVEPRIIRQESMRVDSSRLDVTGLLRNESSQRLESSSGQRPQPQVPKSVDKNSSGNQVNQSTRPNYLPVPENQKSASKYLEGASHAFSIGSPVKTGYEANSKMFPAESNPQKYHEPPKYVGNHHQRHADAAQRNYYAVPPKYIDALKQKPQPQCPTDRFIGSGSPSSPPPPLAPRQNTPGRKSLPPPPRPAPPHAVQGSQSKASYLAYRRERGAPDSEGSYKRTMSPTSRLEDWPPPRDHDDPVLLRVTPHHQLQHHHNHHHHNNHQPELSKSHSVDALHHRLEERVAQQQHHSAEVIGKLSHELNKKLQASDTRSRTAENNNNDNLEDRHQHHHHHHHHLEKRQQEKRHEFEQRRERLSPQSVEVLNDRNRQLERERRKLAASCEPLPQNREQKHSRSMEAPSSLEEDFFRDRSATIEMTSQNIELLNRRNEKRANATSTSTATISTCITTSSTSTTMTISTDSWPRGNEVQTSIETSPATERPPPPTSSPPRSPDQIEGESLRGSVPRRSGSCSSSSSSSRSSDPRISPRSLSNSFSKIEGSPTSRKVSSPTQTENISNRSVSPVRSNRYNELELRVERSSSAKSRSGGRSSTSSISSISKASSSSSPTNSPVQEMKSSPLASPCVSPQPGIEGLTLVQRTEVVLRVNAATSDAASQTDLLETSEAEVCTNTHAMPLCRKKLPEEIECEELGRDLASQLNPNDKLVPLLVPAPEHKKPTDYVSGLFRVEATLHPRPRRRLSLEEPTTPCSENGADDEKKHESIPSTPVTPLSSDSVSPLSPTSAYFTTSEGKARFLARYSRDVTVEGLRPEEAPTVLPTDSLDLRQKKEELMMRLDKKLVVLRAEQEAVREEGEVNEALGARVSTRISAVARPAEASKYRLHVEEVGKITSLLLGLSGRLARAENALYGMPADHAERKILESKRDKLMDQLEEAKILKSNIDKRSVNVSTILSKYLNDEEFADYQHFINMKAKLIVDGREIQDKVKLGEEQLAALREAID